MMLPVVEIFYSLQGEGKFAGVPAVFIRLAGCSNTCNWCDTKEAWSTDAFPYMSIADIMAKVCFAPSRTAIITGGEPLMHNMDKLCYALKQNGFSTHIETSGTEPLSGEWDWVCLSPKQHCPPQSDIYKQACELKVVITCSNDFVWAEQNSKLVTSNCLLLLQPEWGQYQVIVPQIISYILQHPQWQLSLQMHKILQIQ